MERSEEWIKCENVAEKKPEDIGDLSTTGIVKLGTCCHGFNDNLLTNLFLKYCNGHSLPSLAGISLFEQMGGVSKHSLFHIVSDVFLCNFPAGS